MHTARTSTSTAGLGARFAARLIDAVILGGVGLAVGAATGFGIGWFAFQFVLVAAYLVGLDVLTGATAGKGLLGLRVVADDGTDRHPTAAEAARREVFVVAGAVPFVGPVLAAVAWSAIAWSIHTSPTGEGRHDRWSGTRVVTR
jgi:uncharacterized RDD family membrane protein YckC